MHPFKKRVTFGQFIRFCQENQLTTSTIESKEEEDAISQYFNDTGGMHAYATSM